MDEKEMQNGGDQPIESAESPPKMTAPTEDANNPGDVLKQHHQQSLASQVGQGNSNNSSGTFGDGGEQMKIFVTNANVTYHTRHARRIYVGGIPPNYSDEEELRNFFNKVISKGLGIENDHSFVISVYMNQKKCYAFVELNSIELTTACLEMDGIIFKKVTLKIYRANEYRPDMVPPTKYLKLDLTGWSFGLATGAGASANAGAASTAVATPAVFHRTPSAMGMNQAPNGAAGWVAEEPQTPASLTDCIASLIQFINIASIEPGSVAIVGFPYESGSSKSHLRSAPQRGQGTSAAPACLRRCLTSYSGAMIYNAELGLDLSLQPIMDVGDVLAGQSRNETRALLSTTVSELLLRGSAPFLVGGSREQSYYTALGLVAATGVCVGVMNVSAQVDGRLLDSPEFCAPPGMKQQQQQPNGRNGVSPARAQNCYGRYVQFGAQGAQCNAEAVRSVTDRGGHIFWLHKDLRTASTESIAVPQFHRALRNLDACVLHDQQRKGLNTAALRNAYPQAFIMVTIDCGALAGMFNPLAGSSHSSVGLTAEEVLEIAYIAGANPNVALVEVTEFKPDMESDSRLNMFLADLFYKFTLGVASRTQALRGGALGAGAIALSSGVGSGSLSPTAASTGAVTGSAQAQYGGRPAPIVTGPSAKLSQGQRYSSSRDPAIILQQQQQLMQQQAHAGHHAQQQQQQQASQPPVPGRIPYTPQQLQVQQHQQAMMARAAQAQQQQQQQHMRPFPGMNDSPLSSSQSSVRTQQSQHPSPAPPIQAQGMSSVSRAQSHQGYYNGNFDDTLGLPGNSNSGADFGLAGGLQALQVSQGQQPSSVQHGQHSAVRGADEDPSGPRGGGGGGGVTNRPHPIFTPQTSNSTLDSSMLFSHQNSTGTATSSQGSFYRQQGTTSFASSFLNPGAPAFQSDAGTANKWSNYQSNSASLSTPTSAVSQSTAAPAFAHSDWSPAAQHHQAQQADTASGRYSFYSNSTSSLSLGMPSVPSVPSTAQSTPHNANHHGAFPSHYGGLGGSSYRAGGLGDLGATYDDMDKLIGVTNLGHIPSFDDPLDPQYQED